MKVYTAGPPNSCGIPAWMFGLGMGTTGFDPRTAGCRGKFLNLRITGRKMKTTTLELGDQTITIHPQGIVSDAIDNMEVRKEKSPDSGKMVDMLNINIRWHGRSYSGKLRADCSTDLGRMVGYALDQLNKEATRFNALPPNFRLVPRAAYSQYDLVAG